MLWPVFWTSILALTLPIAKYYPSWMFVEMVVALLVVAWLLWRSLGRKEAYKPRMLVILIVVIVGEFVWPIANRKYHWLEAVEIKFGKKVYAECPLNGVSFGRNEILSVCQVNDNWWRWGFTEAVIYDSSGQVGENNINRSNDWARAALSLNSKVPFGIVGFDAFNFGGGYYLVTFFDDKPENVIR